MAIVFQVLTNGQIQVNMTTSRAENIWIFYEFRAARLAWLRAAIVKYK